MNRLTPRALAPDLRLSLIDGSRFDLKQEAVSRFTLIAFYRGAHSEACGESLRELARLRPEFERIGVGCLAASCDTAAAALESAERWGLGGLRVGHGLKIDAARRWGLFITAGVPDEGEPEIFCEPGSFALGTRGELFASAVNNMPFARPRYEDWLLGLAPGAEGARSRGNF